MKFKMRYADKIVGFLSILIIIAAIVLVFAAGSAQSWFERKYSFQTQFDTASNIQAEMSLQYKGFTIGKISKVELKDDKVWADWYILEKYMNYVTYGSLVELVVSPIGLGTQFVFHPGTTSIPLTSGCEIYRTDSVKGLQFIENGLVRYTVQKDSISGLLSQAGTLLVNINDLSSQITAILKGKGDYPLVETLNNVKGITDEVELLVRGINKEVYPQVDGIISNVNQIMKNLNEKLGLVDELVGNVNGAIDSVTGNVDDLVGNVNGAINSVTDNVDEIIGNVNSKVDDITGNVTGNVNSLVGDVNSIVGNVNKVIGTADSSIDSVVTNLNGVMTNVNSLIDNTSPQLNSVLGEINILLRQLEDVMEGLKNNPLLKNGITDRSETGTVMPAGRTDF